MLVKLKSSTIVGVEAIDIEIEINLSSRGFPTFDIIGLPNKSISESKERIKTAIKNSGFDFPNKKITVNLAPADLPKHGSNYDLPIALGIICLAHKIRIPEKSIFLGEMSLDGILRHTRGTLAHALHAKDFGYRDFYVAASCSAEAGLVTGLHIYPVDSLSSLIKHITGQALLQQIQPSSDLENRASTNVPRIIGQEFAKRAFVIAAAGGHHLLLMGPPGSGKTLLARHLVDLLPPLTLSEHVEVVKIHSVSGLMQNGAQTSSLIRPFRAPHHTVSYIGLIGGTSKLTPGEISLAHNGVLFLDELLEFPRAHIESLRQPLENGEICITRGTGFAKLPSKFILVAACNPCPCGFKQHPSQECTCSEHQISRYRAKLSGPIMDRIDMHVFVRPLALHKLSASCKDIPYEKTFNNSLNSVLKARNIQYKRFRGFDIITNAEMHNKQIHAFCKLSRRTESLLVETASKFNMSARGYYRTLKLARTIADLGNSVGIEEEHLMEAFQYRFR